MEYIKERVNADPIRDTTTNKPACCNGSLYFTCARLTAPMQSHFLVDRLWHEDFAKECLE